MNNIKLIIKLKLSKELIEALSRQAESMGISLSMLINNILSEYNKTYKE